MGGEAERGREHARPAAPGLAGVGCAHQHAVLQHAVVVDADGHEDEVARALRVEGRNHVVDQPELGLAQPPVAAEPAFGIDRLHHAARRGRLHVARQHLAVEPAARAAPDEVGAERAHQHAQRPDPRPFADGVAQRGAVRRHVGDDHVVHVAAVVHHEDHAGAGLDAGQRLVVGIAEAHAIEGLHRTPGDVIGDAEIGVGVEGRDDLAGVALHLPAQHLARRAGGLSLRVDRLHDLGVVAELVDEDPAPGLLEGRDLQLQPRVDLFDHAVEAAAQEPARARHQDAVERGPERERADHAEDPERDRQRFAHARLSRPGGQGPSDPGGFPGQGRSRQRALTDMGANWARGSTPDALLIAAMRASMGGAPSGYPGWRPSGATGARDARERTAGTR